MKKVFQMVMMLFVLLLVLPVIGMAGEYTTGEGIITEKEEEMVKLEDVVVTATKTEDPRGNVPGSVSVITKEEIKDANIESAGDALRWVAGARLKKGGFRGGDPNITTVSLLGLPAEYALVLVNGQRVFGGGSDSGSTPQSVDLEQYPAEMIERIEVIKGAGSCLYGSQAVSGVINIITKSAPKKPSLFVSASSGTHDTKIYKASHGLTIDKFGYFLSYTRRESDGIDPETHEFETDNLYANLSYDFTPSVKITLQPSYYRQDEVYNKQKSETHGFNSILDWRPDESSKFKIRLSGNEYEQEKTRAGSMGSPAQKHEQENNRYEAELSYTRPFFDINLITLGYQHFKEKYKYPYYIDDQEQTMNSGFIQDEINFDPFTVTLAGRVDDYDRWGMSFCPRAGLTYRATDNLKFGASIGKSFKAPAFNELYYNGWLMGSTLMFGNPDLDPEEAIGYQAGAEYRYGNIIIQYSLFRNDIKDMIEWETISEDYQGTGYRAWHARNISEAYTQGIEFNIGMNFTGNLQGRLGYTFVDSEDEETGEDLSYTPEHDLNAELNYKESRYIPHINLRGEYVGKRYTTGSSRTPKEELDDYFLVHVKFSKIFFKRFNTFLSIDNIFDKKCEEESEMPGAEFLGGMSVNF